MSITDELRKWAEEFWEFAYSKFGDKSDLIAIADRIDAEHEEAIQQALMDEGGVPATDENMAEYGWMRLPVDADGEYIHIGDVMVSKDGKVHRVDSLTRNPIGSDPEWSVRLALLNDVFGAGSLVRYRPDALHHHTPDTWERIIEDAREYMLNIGGSYLWKNKSDELVARCKALAGDAE